MNSWGCFVRYLVSVSALLVMLGVARAGLASTPQIAAGKDFSISLRSDGTLWAFGNNDLGQLGDGTVQQRNAPIQVGLPDNGANWTTVAAGVDHTVAVKADGSLWSWGGNAAGQLGIGSHVSSSSPAQVGSARDWVAVATGASSTIALKSDGSLWAWGVNDFGQLGNGDAAGASQELPVAVLNTGSSAFVSVSISNKHVLALQADGTLWSWGANQSGQLGANTVDASIHATPLQLITGDLAFDSSWIAVSAGGAHSVAQQSDGTLWIWGDNSVGQLGNGSGTGNSPAPSKMGSSIDWAGFSAGATHTVAFKRAGTLWTWGGNTTGQLGIGGVADPDPHNLPLQITTPLTISSMTAVAAGFGHSLSVKANGDLFAWGDNLRGQLGAGATVPSTLPLPVIQAAGGWVGVEPGGQHTLARRSDGSLWAWGDNSSGQAGNDPLSSALLFPVQVGSAVNWSILSGGLLHTAALQADGTLWTWGSNSSGQLGDGTTNDHFPPQQITVTAPASSANQWVTVSSGDTHTLALQTDGSMWAWGDNSSGQLGDGTTDPHVVPTQIVTGNPGNFDNNWVAVSAGGLFSVGLQSDGTMWIWGDNSFGQFGVDPLLLSSASSPFQIQNLVPVAGSNGFNSSWKAIAAGFNHLLGLQADGTVWGLGSNSVGQLGNGSSSVNQFEFFPVQNVGLPLVPYVAVAAGDSHSVLLKADGSLWTMGNNTSGQLGIGSTDPDILTPVVHATPVREISAANDWVSIAAGGRHTVALKADGTLASWGENLFGQLGDGTILLKNAPTPLDTVAPVLTITAGPIFFTNSNALTLSGTVESGAQLSLVSHTSAGVGPVTLSGVDATSWSSTISNLVLGANTITVTATDASGNTSTQTATITYDLSPFTKRLSDAATDAAIQPLYDGIPLSGLPLAASETIQLRSVTLTESPIFNRSGVALTLNGGYAAGFAGPPSGVTSLKGKMSVRQGTVRVSRVTIH